MEKLGIDLFELNCNYYLLVVDYYSGYIMYYNHKKTPTSEGVQYKLNDWFFTYGWPTEIRTDTGPQFRGSFEQFFC